MALIFLNMDENDISFIIRGCSFKVHNKLGPGLLESVYERALSKELLKAGMTVKNQVGISMSYDDICFDCGFRLDIIVNNLVIIEVKSVDTLIKIHYKQLLTYLKLTEKKLGILINFNSVSLDKNSLVRIVNKL